MNYAVLADLNATRADCTCFLNALKELDGNILYCKFYSYNPKRDSGYSRYIRSAGADVAVPLYNRKKARIDMRQVIDAVSICCTNATVDAFFIICASVDCTSLLSYLKSAGKYVALGGDSEPSYASGYDRFVHLNRIAAQDPPSDGVKKESKALISDEEVARRLNMRRLDAPPDPAPREEKAAYKGEFLPFTGIRDEKDSMLEVKERLDEILRAKKNASVQPVQELPAPEDMDTLLKKYF